MGDQHQMKRGHGLKLAYLYGREVYEQGAATVGPRELDDFELKYVLDGSVVYALDGVEQKIPTGGAVFGRPGAVETYRWNPNDPSRYIYFCFNFIRYPDDWTSVEELPRVFLETHPLCKDLFRHIIQHIYEHPEWVEVAPGRSVCRLLEALIDTLIEPRHLEMMSLTRERPEAIRRALRLMRTVIEESPDKLLKLRDIAKHANVSEKYLCRLFSETLDCSPMRTFTLIKLHAARVLLARTNLTVKQIALRSGFEDAYYFSRRFSKDFGCSPSEFRRRLRNGEPIDISSSLPMDMIPHINW